jgi:hypothetical protein
MTVEDDLQEPLLERLSATPEAETPKSASKKRKRGDSEQVAKKAAKKTKSKKAKSTAEDELDIDAGLNNAFSHMDSQLLADYMAQRTRKFESDLSSIELEDKFIPGMKVTLHERCTLMEFEHLRFKIQPPSTSLEVLTICLASWRSSLEIQQRYGRQVRRTEHHIQ